MSGYFSSWNHMVNDMFGGWVPFVIFLLIALSVDYFVSWLIKRFIGWSAEDFECRYRVWQSGFWEQEHFSEYIKHKIISILRGLLDVIIGLIIIVVFYDKTEFSKFIIDIFRYFSTH